MFLMVLSSNVFYWDIRKSSVQNQLSCVTALCGSACKVAYILLLFAVFQKIFLPFVLQSQLDHFLHFIFVFSCQFSSFSCPLLSLRFLYVFFLPPFRNKYSRVSLKYDAKFKEQTIFDAISVMPYTTFLTLNSLFPTILQFLFIRNHKRESYMSLWDGYRIHKINLLLNAYKCKNTHARLLHETHQTRAFSI